MQITIEYEKACRNELAGKGYTAETLDAAAKVIADQFSNAAHRVYSGALQRPLPDFIEVSIRRDLVFDDKENDYGTTIAACRLKMFDKDPLRFYIDKSLIQPILDGKDVDSLTTNTIIHEMVHTVDADMLDKISKVLVDLEVATMGVNGPLEDDEWDRVDGLRTVLEMLRRFRNEGVAILSTCLLNKSKFEAAPDYEHVFRRIFVRTFRQVMKERYDDDDRDFMVWIKSKTYQIAPGILVMVLAELGSIDKETAEKILQGFETGRYGLTEEEVSAIMKAALALSLPEFVEGLLIHNDREQAIGHLPTFLDYCTNYQEECRDDQVKAFAELMRLPFCATGTFNDAMRKIVGELESEEALNQKCQAFLDEPLDEELYPDFKEKVTRLQSAMQNTAKADKSQVAQWALTYLFSGKGLVSNDLPILGRVDDLLVVDKALKVIKGHSLEAFARYLISTENQ